jgi:hypothetical protein
MVRIALQGFFAALHDILHRPWVILWICLGLAFVNLVLDGTLLRMWSLNREFNELQVSSIQVAQDVDKLKARLKAAADPSFVEREARDRFDLVSKGDLVFVFAEDE